MLFYVLLFLLRLHADRLHLQAGQHTANVKQFWAVENLVRHLTATFISPHSCKWLSLHSRCALCSERGFWLFTPHKASRPAVPTGWGEATGLALHTCATGPHQRQVPGLWVGWARAAALQNRAAQRGGQRLERWAPQGKRHKLFYLSENVLLLSRGFGVSA